jgi:multidrug efflux pump subunit AcrB
LLVGLVVNNAIVLVEYINQLRKKINLLFMMRFIEAAALRVRPILLTSLTTIIGLLPLVFGWGEGLEMLKPLAITVVGGLSVSMLLTLFVIPSIYTAVHRS